MTGRIRLPIEAILEAPLALPPAESVGRSRSGKPLFGYRFGSGSRNISLIAGCHADEPVGPAMLQRLCAYLGEATADNQLLREYSWFIVSDANPDGAERNATWSERTVDTVDHLGRPDVGYKLGPYVEQVARELPGEDVEFGFPRDANDDDARPENRAIADFLRQGAPFTLHASFHGMDFAVGPWFLIERAWIGRTAELRDTLRSRVREMGYRLFDIDRGGEKGFDRIDEGFTTRPDSVAMAEHFLALDDQGTAALFRPSSMEFVRSLGGDPFTFVSEMPLFLIDPKSRSLPTPTSPESRKLFHDQVVRLSKETESGHGPEPSPLRPMPIRDQMRLQLEFLAAGLTATRG